LTGPHARLTTDRRLGAGAVLRCGASAPYRAIEVIDGERHVLRDEFAVAGQPGAPVVKENNGGARRPLACLVHVTDLQLADVQSPTRFEFLNRFFADPRYAGVVPVQRPQEALTPHAVDATLRTVNAVRGPATGSPPQLVVTTGDAIDNAQWNEVQLFLALFEGGLVTGNSGAAGYAGVQALDWPDDIFWKPDGAGRDGLDFFRREFGFPHHPGLLDFALRSFRAGGLHIPWLSCFGNHEALNQGVGRATPGIAAALVGDRKPVSPPDGFDHNQALELFTSSPEVFMTGATRPVAADLRPGAQPAGHGFTEQNRRDGTAYYVHDTPAIRFIALDTNCLAGGADGCLDQTQARWLEARLAEVHAHYRGPAGEEVRTGHGDRLVVLFSHHGVDTLTNTRYGHRGPDGEPLLGAPEFLVLLYRFGNVVLWLNGHTHINSIRARRDPADPARGFWEVTTCAVVDWPCQTRVVEVTDMAGELAITCTMVDHDSPLAPRSLDSAADLAGLHRELAANVPVIGAADPGRPGLPSDRNVELRIRAPFPLCRLPGC
jgi:metallophosphoesterase (TIGR03767 family)